VGHAQDVLLQEWGKDLEKRTGGKVKVNYYAGGTLVPAAQSYDAAVKGIADVSNHVMGYTMGRFPFSQVMDLPIGFPPGAGPTNIAKGCTSQPKEFDDVSIVIPRSLRVGSHSKAGQKLEDIKV
jgi:hypothetical protein